MIGRLIFPTPVHQVLTILVVLLLAGVFTVIYSSENGLQSQNITTFGSNTLYGEYYYLMGFNSSYKEKIENSLSKVTSRYNYLSLCTIYITNSTNAGVRLNNENISLNTREIFIMNTSTYHFLSFRYVKTPKYGVGIILGYEIYRALMATGSVKNMKITLSTNSSKIFSYSGKVIGVLGPTPSDTVNAGIFIVEKKIPISNLYLYPKYVIFKYPQEYDIYKYAIAEDLNERGIPIVMPQESHNAEMFVEILNFAALFTGIALLFAISTYSFISKKIWLKELAMAILSGSGERKVFMWMFLRSLIVILVAIPIGTLLGFFVFNFIISSLPPTYYFYFNPQPVNVNIVFLNLALSTIAIFLITLFMFKRARKRTTIEIIREVFY